MPIGQISSGQMFGQMFWQMAVNKMSIGQICVNKMFVGQMSVGSIVCWRIVLPKSQIVLCIISLSPVSVSQMSCDPMYVIQMRVSQVSVSQLPVGETIFDQKTSSLSQNLALTCLSTTELMKKKQKKSKMNRRLHNFVNSLSRCEASRLVQMIALKYACKIS
jgi:hypothetical protein